MMIMVAEATFAALLVCIALACGVSYRVVTIGAHTLSVSIHNRSISLNSQRASEKEFQHDEATGTLNLGKDGEFVVSGDVHFQVDTKDPKLGGGADGTVYRGKATWFRQQVPIDVALKRQLATRSSVMETECTMLKYLNENAGPHIIKLLWHDESYEFAMLERGAEDLATFARRQFASLRTACGIQAVEILARAYFVQVLDAVNKMHAHKIYHRDLKPANIIVMQGSYENKLLVQKRSFCPMQTQRTETVRLCKVADFGLAISNPMVSVRNGTDEFMAPELFLVGDGVNHRYAAVSTNEKTDVWALGMILVYLLIGPTRPAPRVTTRTGHEEFNAVDLREWSEQLVRNVYRQRVSEDVLDLLSHMLEFDAGYRWVTEQVIDHPWIKEAFYALVSQNATIPRAHAVANSTGDVSPQS